MVDLKETTKDEKGDTILGAIDTLKNSKNFEYEKKKGHVFKDGVITKGQQDFREQGGPPSLQISYLTDKKTGDIDVDYFHQYDPRHLSPCNSDIRCGDHLKEHNEHYGNPLRNIPTTPEK